VTDAPPAPAESPEGGRLGDDQGREPGREADLVATPRARELGLATATVVVGFGILTACLVVFGSLARDIRAKDVFVMDAWATPFLHGLASPGMDSVMNAITTLGTIFVIVPAFAIVGALLVRAKRVRSVAFLVVAMLGSFVLQLVLKPYFARPRPDVAYAALVSDYSFPSGHTLNAVVFYGAVALVIWSLFGRRAGVASVAAAAIIALAVGVSRIYLGYHFLTDVLGAILAGTAWLLVAALAFRARPTWRRWRAKGRLSSPGGQTRRDGASMTPHVRG
jgi:membrane-associated phospholipid phosphatase